MMCDQSLLELFVCAKWWVKQGQNLTKQLGVNATEILNGLCPGHQKLDSKDVLDQLENDGEKQRYDLAVLCFEALTFVKSNKDPRGLYELFENELPESFWKNRLFDLLCLHDQAFNGDYDPNGYVSRLEGEISKAVSLVYPNMKEETESFKLDKFFESIKSAQSQGRCYFCMQQTVQPSVNQLDYPF